MFTFNIIIDIHHNPMGGKDILTTIVEIRTLRLREVV